jgi:uncharacterized membrane protein HdeD (DUF308 family)
MTKNVGKIDSIVRIVLAVILAYLDWSGTVTGTLSWVVGIAAVVMLVTAFVKFCPYKSIRSRYMQVLIGFINKLKMPWSFMRVIRLLMGIFLIVQGVVCTSMDGDNIWHRIFTFTTTKFRLWL